MQQMMKNSMQVYFLSRPIVFQTGNTVSSSSTYNELQWSLLDTSRESDMESIQEIHEAFQNLEKARVIIAWMVLDGVMFMEEFRLNDHHHTQEQQNTMKQELASIHQLLGLIQAMDGF